MNAAQHHNQLSGEGAGVFTDASVEGVCLSAMVDGEVSAAELDALLASGLGLPSSGLGDWHAYQVIGDVLRGHEDATGATSAIDFLSAVRTGMQAQNVESVALGNHPSQFHAVRANTAVRDAANDAVFRWKLVAGFASVAAVIAVSWNVLVGSGGSLDGSTGPQLALSAPGTSETPGVQPATVTAAATLSTAVPLVVNTGQGVLIRDAQLEALLAEHRQHGGMSALQMPSGFIRNATYDSAGR